MPTVYSSDKNQTVIVTTTTMATPTDLSTIRGNYRSYSLAQKKRAVEMADQDGLKPTARLLKIPPSTIRTWRAKLAKGKPLYIKNPGAQCKYPEAEKVLCAWILDRRDRHMPVSRTAISDQARRIIADDEFTASAGWLDRFLRRNGLSVRCKTSVAQRLPEDLAVRQRIFLRQVQELMEEHEFDTECIVNMDETPAYFDLVPGKTVDKKGTKDVIVRSTGAHKRHITVVLAVSATGKTLPPMVIFKGKRFPKDIKKIPDGIFVEVHPNGWMTQEIMVRWVNEVLKPYTKRRPSLLVMDSFAGHTTDSVSQHLWKNNVTPAIIPGGCTSKVQPLDVSINKPFKSHLRDMWISYLEKAVSTARVQTPCRQTMLEWIQAAWHMISLREEMIKKSFQVTGILPAVSNGQQEIARHAKQLAEALGDDNSNSFHGFTQEDLPPSPTGYDSDPFLLSDED